MEVTSTYVVTAYTAPLRISNCFIAPPKGEREYLCSRIVKGHVTLQHALTCLVSIAQSRTAAVNFYWQRIQSLTATQRVMIGRNVDAQMQGIPSC